MRKIKLLDCTLRDGGYVNNNIFGLKNIKRIVDCLERAHLDIIECGYLMEEKNKAFYDATEYQETCELEEQGIIGSKKNVEYTLMLLGEKFNISSLPDLKSTQVKTIRMSFHKKGMKEALKKAKIIKEKGYNLYLQPTVTMGYNDEEIINMLTEFNQYIKPDAVAIVDTFGQMKPEDIKHYALLFDKYLSSNISLGFHAHNNLQMAYSNAVTFIEYTKEERSIFIDSSLFGMGRGAGNLPTELLARYLNETYETHYSLEPLLEAMDEVISNIYNEKPWGYSLEYYLSGIYGCHPSYVLNFISKRKLPMQDINALLCSISTDKKADYDKEYADELYLTYNERRIDDDQSITKLSKILENKKILIIGPGQSLIQYADVVTKFQKENNAFSISLNGINFMRTDAVFFSNKKRYQERKNDVKNEMVFLTSNVEEKEKSNQLIFDYQNALFRNKEQVSDNSLLMMIEIIKRTGSYEIVLAGCDGYTDDNHSNFYDSSLEYLLDQNYKKELNNIIELGLQSYPRNKIKSLTPTKYQLERRKQ